jgi:hypothetical protein
MRPYCPPGCVRKYQGKNPPDCNEIVMVARSELIVSKQNGSDQLICNLLKRGVEHKVSQMAQNPSWNLKTAVPERVPGVRIPLPPPASLNCRETARLLLRNTQNMPVLVPLLDPKVSLAERVSIANRLVPARIESSEQAIAVLVASNDPCLRSCGVHAVGIFRLKSLEHELNRCLDHPDSLLRETARQAKLRLQKSQAPSA